METKVTNEQDKSKEGILGTIKYKILSNNFLFNFYSNPQLNKSINNSRKFNSYHNLIEIISIFGQQIVFKKLEQSQLNLYFILFSGGNILANMIITRGTKYKQYKMMMIISLVLMFTYCFPILELNSKISTNNTICDAIAPYAAQICQENKKLYNIWLIMAIFFICFRMIGIMFAFNAFVIIKQAHNIIEIKKRNRAEYQRQMAQKKMGQNLLEEDSNRKL